MWTCLRGIILAAKLRAMRVKKLTSFQFNRKLMKIMMRWCRNVTCYVILIKLNASVRLASRLRSVFFLMRLKFLKIVDGVLMGSDKSVSHKRSQNICELLLFQTQCSWADTEVTIKPLPHRRRRPLAPMARKHPYPLAAGTAHASLQRRCAGGELATWP